VGRRAILLACALAACEEPAIPIPVGESVHDEARSKVDVLFVIDNSSGAIDYYDRLFVGLDRFARLLGGVDHQIGVISTDLDSPSGERAGEIIWSYKSDPPYTSTGGDVSGCFSVPVAHGCLRGEPRIVSSSLSEEERAAALVANAHLGNCGAGTERPLDATIRALERSDPGDCNAGFFRDDALLVVIIVTDSEDSDAPGFNPPQVEDFAARLFALKPAEKLRVAMIVGAKDGEPARCGLTPECGSLCEMPIPESSHAPCSPGPASCPAGEVCQVDACLNEDARFWGFCWDCGAYRAPDCCFAYPGTRLVELARILEPTIASTIDGAVVNGCRPAPNQHACLVESICDLHLDDVLERIARSLIPSCRAR
jgi:hypothetical protein